MSWICFILSITLSFLAQADEFNFDGENLQGKETIFVSLGNNCWTAQALRAAGIRKTAFPFDWLFSQDDEGLNRAIEDDFLYFTDPKYFCKDP